MAGLYTGNLPGALAGRPCLPGSRSRRSLPGQDIAPRNVAGLAVADGCVHRVTPDARLICPGDKNGG